MSFTCQPCRLFFENEAQLLDHKHVCPKTSWKGFIGWDPESDLDGEFTLVVGKRFADGTTQIDHMIQVKPDHAPTGVDISEFGGKITVKDFVAYLSKGTGA